MYCNRFPERNVGFIPYVKEILHMLDGECLAIEPIQLNLKLERGREMKNPICTECNTEMEFDTGEEKCSDCLTSDYGGHCIDDVPEPPKEVQSRSLLNYNVGKCPCCTGDLWVQCRSKADIEDYSGVCDLCGYIDNR